MFAPLTLIVLECAFSLPPRRLSARPSPVGDCTPEGSAYDSEREGLALLHSVSGGPAEGGMQQGKDGGMINVIGFIELIYLS